MDATVYHYSKLQRVVLKFVLDYILYFIYLYYGWNTTGISHLKITKYM